MKQCIHATRFEGKCHQKNAESHLVQLTFQFQYKNKCGRDILQLRERYLFEQTSFIKLSLHC